MSGVVPANLSAISTCVVCVARLGEPRTCDLLDLAGLAVEAVRSATSTLEAGANCRAMAC